MVLDYNTNTFHTIRKSLDERIAQGGEVSVEERDQIISSHGVEPEEYLQEYNTRYIKARDEHGYDPDDEVRSPAEVVGQTAGTAVGKVGEGIINLGAAVLPDSISKGIEIASDGVAEYIPDEVKRAFASTFDPYHGEGLLEDSTQLAGQIGSYFLGGGPFAKGAGWLLKSSMGTQKAAGKVGTALKWGVGGTLGATLVEDPSEENYVNLISSIMEENHPDTYDEYKDYLDTLSIDPDDPKAKQYFQALFNNLALEGVLGAGLGLTAKVAAPVVEKFTKAAHRVGNSSTGVKSSLLTNLMEKAVPNVIKRNFSSRFGTDDKMLELVLARENAAKGALTRASGYNEDLQKVLKRDGLYNEQYLNTTVNDALAGDKKAMAQLTSDSMEGASIVGEMRKAIDDLSTEFKKTGVKEGSKLYAKIDKNKGTYINRAYKIFDDPNYNLKDVDINVREEVESYLENDLKIPKEYVPQVLRNLTEGVKEKKEVFNKLGEFAAGTSNPIRKLKDIPEPIRKLWGEKKNPFDNFSRTFEKLSNFQAQVDLAEGVRSHMLSKGLAREGIPGTTKWPDAARPADEFGMKTLGETYESMLPLGRSSEFKNPLEGLYGNKDYQQFLKDGTDIKQGATNSLIRHWLKAKAVSQMNVTALDSSTHGRNVMGNITMMLANGMLPTPKSWTNQFKLTGSKFKKLNNRDLTEQLARMQELGVVDSSVKANTIRRVATDAFTSDYDTWTKKISARTPVKVGKKALNKALDLYQAEDDFFKIMHFEKSKDYIRKAFPKLDNVEIEKMAAQRTRDLMPNYALVPKALKRLRGAPIGDFMSFPAEILRNSTNLFKYTLEDLASKNPVLRKAGAKRLAGMAAIGSAGDAAMHYSANIFSITDEDQKAINQIVPQWERDTGKIFTSGVKRDKRNNVIVDYYNLGPLDPYEYVKTAFRSASRYINDDKPYTLEGAEDLDIQLGDQVLGTYLGSSMLTDAFIDVAKQDYDDMSGTELITNFLLKTGESLGKTLALPGTLKRLDKRREFEIAKANERGDPEYNLWGMRFGGSSPFAAPTGREVTKYGAHFNPNSVGMGSFLGLRENTLDITKGFEWNIKRGLDGVQRKGTHPLYKELSQYNVRDPNQVTRAYLDGQQDKLSEYKKLRNKLMAYKQLFPDLVYDMEKGLGYFGGRKRNKKDMQILFDALDNIFRSDDIPISGVRRAIDATGAPIPYDRIREIKEQLDFTEIE